MVAKIGSPFFSLFLSSVWDHTSCLYFPFLFSLFFRSPLLNIRGHPFPVPILYAAAVPSLSSLFLKSMREAAIEGEKRKKERGIPQQEQKERERKNSSVEDSVKERRMDSTEIVCTLSLSSLLLTHTSYCFPAFLFSIHVLIPCMAYIFWVAVAANDMIRTKGNEV